MQMKNKKPANSIAGFLLILYEIKSLAKPRVHDIQVPGIYWQHRR
jgi:hypothetical protein